MYRSAVESTDLTDSQHWHGLSMAVSPFSDGTPMASQWPIPPLHFFDYEIHVPAGMAGTYFYHSHVGFQAISAAGPLIVEDKEPPYHYDDEKIIFLSDTFNISDHALESGLLANPFKWSGETGMVLINGRGGGTNNGTSCNSSLSVINVEPCKTYRLRFIGGTALTFASLAIQGHESMSVIEADG
jgi:L-ascorbate oxidase